MPVTVADHPGGRFVHVGAWHVPLADLLTAVARAGLVLTRVAESGSGRVPDILAFRAAMPA